MRHVTVIFVLALLLGGVAPALAVTITTGASATLTTGAEEWPLGASGGSGTYTWALVSGALPTGLALRTDVPSEFTVGQQAGLIGVATTPGTYNFTLSVTDGIIPTPIQQAFAVRITALNIPDTPNLPDAFTGTAYSYTFGALNAANGGTNLAFSVSALSSLPAGLSLSSAGVLSGSPTSPGQYNFGVTIQDGVDTVSGYFNLNISAVQITTAGLLPSATQNVFYSQTLAASGGSGGYTFSVSGGQVPTGLFLFSGGGLSGSVSAPPGLYAFAVTAKDSSNNTYTKQMAIVVGALASALPEISVGRIDDITVGSPSSFSISVCCGGQAPFTWSASGLPAGMAFRYGSSASSGISPGNVEIWGIPQTAGAYTFQLTLTDANGLTTTQSVPVHVSALFQNPGLPSGTINAAYSGALRILGGTGPYTVTQVGGTLPDGVTLKASQLLVSGTPLENGSFGPIFQFKDASAPADTLVRTAGLAVANANPGINITSNSNLGTYSVNGFIFQNLNACCVSGYNWTVAAGSLPSGVTLFSDGFLDGSPSIPGTYTFLIEAADQASVASPGYEQFTLTVTPISIVSGSPLPQGNIGTAYSEGLQASGGTGTLTWTLTSGSELPPGLTLSTGGAILGTPTSTGQYSFTVTVTDTANNSNSVGFTIVIYPPGGGPPLSITNPPGQITLTTGTQQYPLGATGGTGTYAWSLTSGSLPPGLALRSDVPSNFGSSAQAGFLGVATTPGTYNFTLTVTSGVQSVPQAFTVRITALNAKDLNSLPTAFIGTAYSYTLTALNPANGGSGVSFTVAEGNALAPGLTLSTAGVISGTPTGFSGQYPFGIDLTDGTDTVLLSFNLNVSAVQIATPGQLPNASQNATYNQTLTASGGSGTTVFDMAGGQLPNGLNLSSSGTISGTVEAGPGNFTFSVSVFDSAGSYTKQMAIDVLESPVTLPEISVQHLDDLTLGDASSFNIGPCCGGVAPFTWSASGLPTGMSFRYGDGNTSANVNPGNVEIWGVPQIAGNYTVALTLTDDDSNSTTQSIPLHVSLLDQQPAISSGTLGVAYAQPLHVLGGTGPYSATLQSGALPDGLSVNSGTMQVTGTPLENGSFSPVFQFKDSATNANTLVRTNGLSINNVNNGIIIFTQSNLGTFTVGTFDTNFFTACCVSTYAWSVTSGSLPPGMSLASSGEFSGQFTTAGTYTFLVKAADASAVDAAGSKQFTVTVTPISITTGGLPFGNVGTAYSQPLAATGGTGTLTWTLNANGSLPPGLTLSTAGVISGTPTSTGQYGFTVTVTDANSNTASHNFNIAIYVAGGGPPIVTTSSSTLTFTTGTQQYALGASGGTGTYAWALTSGSLPPGIALRTDVPANFSPNQQAGLIGVATTPGNYTFTLTVTSGSQSVPQAFSVRITALNIQNSRTLPDSFVGVPYSYQLTALNPAAAPTFSATGLPAGLTISTSGLISGTPSAAAFTSSAVNSEGASTTNDGSANPDVTLNDGTDIVSLAFNCLVHSVKFSTQDFLGNAMQGGSFNVTLGATAGAPPYTFSAAPGQGPYGGLPPGLTMNSSGTISGTVNSQDHTGPYLFTVTVSDTNGETYNGYFEINVVGAGVTPPGLTIPHVDTLTVGNPAPPITVNECCGGTGPFSFIVTGLPAGMTSTNQAGTVVLSGIPQATGAFPVTVEVVDANGAVAEQTFTLNVVAMDQPQTAYGCTKNESCAQTLRTVGGVGKVVAQLVAGSLPFGLGLVPDPSLTGSPIENGNFSPVFQFTDSATPPNVLVRTNPINVFNGNNGITIGTPPNLGTVLAGTSYSDQLNACCVSAYTWSVSSGTLPAGIALSSSGLLAGTPTSVGTYNFLIEAADQASVAPAGFEEFTLIVTPISITTNGLPNGTVSAAYSQALAATGGTGTLTWTLNADSYLPLGLTLSSAGVIGGTPTNEGQYPFTVTVTDADGNTQIGNFSITINPVGGLPLNIVTAAAQTFSMGTTQYPLTASGGTGTYTWSLTSGSLPPGLAVRSDVPSFFNSSQQAGLIGVATTPGTYSFTLTVASGSQSTPQAFTVTITALNIKDLSTLPDSFANTAYAFTFAALNPANSGADVAFTVSEGSSLPAGFTLNTGGTLSGTPTSPGQYSFGVTLTDGVDTISRGYNLLVSAVQITTAGLLANGTQGASYSQTISASGGSGGYTYSLSGGNLPNGLGLSSSGVISGALNTGPGLYGFGVQVADSSNNSYTKQMSIDVIGTTPALPEISLGDVDDAVLGDTDTFSVSVCCGGTAPFAWSVTGLPSGMSARLGGANHTSSYVFPGNVEIWGVPYAAGNYAVQLTLSDANSNSTTQSFTFKVSNLDQNPQLSNGTLGTAYSQSLRVLGGTGPYSVSQVGGALPDGIALNGGAMTVTGTPLETGNFGPILSFTDSATPAHVLVRTNGMNISNLAGTSVFINNISAFSNTATAPLGIPYSNQLSACCVAAYTWTVAGGSLPTGITLSSSGLLSGTPTVSGTSTFLAKASDQAAVANPGYAQFTLIVTPITITTNGFPYGNVGTAYSQTLAATGGSGTLTWTLNASNYLPPGLTLSTAGVLSGTPASAGQYNFTVTVTDASNNTNTRNYDMNVYVAGGGPPPSITTGSNATVTTGDVQFALNASGGSGTYVWSLTSGTLPPGLALRTDVPSNFNSSQQAGLIGVATTTGTYNFTLSVSSASQSAQQAFTFNVTSLNIKDLSTLPDAFVGAAYSYALTALNPAGTPAFSVSSNSTLPAGLSLSSAGVLSGTPTASGQDSFSIVLSDGTNTITRNFNLKVSAVQITTAGLLPNGTQGGSYNQNLAATGGSGGYTYSLNGGLPNGLSLSSSGTISGTITAGAGVFGFGVAVKDSSNNSYTKEMSINVIGSTPALPDISLGHVDDAVIGNTDSFTVTACCGGTAPFSWSVTGFPTGMSFRTGGGVTSSNVAPGNVEIWGIPQTAGNYTVQLTLTDANSNTARQSFALHVSQIDENPNLPGGTLGSAYSQTLRFLGGTSPYTTTLIGAKFPDGLAFANGATKVAGTPLENGNFGPILSVTDSSTPPNTLVRTNGMNIANLAGSSISINSNSSLGPLLAGSSYSNQLSACCVSAYAWSVVAGTLPTGITLSSAGLLSGTPTVAGTYTFLIKAADQAAVANPGFEQFTLIVTPITITTGGLPYGNLTVAYSQTLAATGGTGTLTWTLASANYLPPGLALSSAGVISGTPTATGQYGFTVVVTDASNNTATHNFSVSIYSATGGPPLTVTATTNTTQPTGVVQYALGASGGTGTYAWALTAGSLPPGLALRTDVPSTFSSSQQAGLIGIPTATGTYAFTLTVTSGAQSTPQAFSMKITALNIKDLGTLPQAYVGAAYSYTFTAANPAATPSFTHGTLPAGLSLSSTGVLSGTPTAASSAHISVTVADGTDTVTKTFALNIAPIQITTAEAMPNATQNVAYNQTLAASGGTGGYSYTMESGSLPPGLNLSSGGTITGTVASGQTPGLYAFEVGVFDSSNNFDEQWMSIDVIGDPPMLPEVAQAAFSAFVVGGSGSAVVRACCGGVAPFTWTVTGLPAGMSYRYGAANTSSTVAPGNVEIWGIPQAAGDYTPQFTVTDADGATGTLDLAMHVSTIVQNPALPNGTLGTPYSAALRVIGGAGPYSGTILKGALPDGLTFNSTAMTVSGTPLENGSFGLSFQFNDSTSPTSNYALQGESFSIANSSNTGISLNATASLLTQVGIPYTYDLTSNYCCSDSVTLSVTSGSLPPGIMLDSYGILSGTPTASGTYKFLVKATDPSATEAPGYEQIALTVSPFANTSGTLPNGTVGTAYSQALPVSGGTAPIAWGLGFAGSLPAGYVSSLPPGLTLSSSGTLSGTPANSGQYSFIANVTDANSNTDYFTFTLSIYPAGVAPPFVITNPATATLSTGTIQYPLNASGGTGVYTWSLASGNLPPGLALRTDVPSSFASNQQAGLIGVATTPGTYNFTLNVASGGQNTSQAFTMKITALNFKDALIPDLLIGVPYSYTLSAVGNAAPVTFEYVSGGNDNLDPLNLTADGTLSGTLGPGAAGVYNLVLSVTDGTDTVYCNCKLYVYAVNITQGLLPNGTQNAAYNQTITAGGGTGGYTFAVTSGPLPNGLTLSSSGTLSGTINDQPGRYAFAVTATDSSANSYTKYMSLDVIGATPALTEITVGEVDNAASLESPSLGEYAEGPNGEITLGEMDDAVVGDTYSGTAGTCCGGVAPFTWTASGLPAGMSIRYGSGVAAYYVTPGDVEIWGVPQAAGNYTVQLTATDANGLATTLSFPFHVSVLDRTPRLPNGTIGSPYSGTLRVLGGTGPYTLQQAAASIPDGITQTGALQIGGTPLENGSFNPVVLYTDSATPPNTLLRTDSFTVNNLPGAAITIDTGFKLLAVAGSAFSQQLSACCVASYSWSVAGGALPTGLTLSSSGLLSGTPTVAGTYQFLVEAADQAAVAHPGYRQFQLFVHPIAVTTASLLPAATQGSAYSQTLAATGGVGTLAWSVLGAGFGPYLPAGLTLSSNGVLSGMPTSAGQYSFIFVATDTDANTGRSQFTLNINPAASLLTQSITFGALSGVTYGVSPFTVAATASSGLTVAFSSTTTPVCTVSGTTVTILAGGACSIVASQPGNATYAAAAPVTEAFTVSAASQTITFGGLGNVTYGASPFAISATASSGLTVAFASTTTSVCTVSGTTVTILSGGACSITASQSGNGSYSAAAPMVQGFTVNPASQNITFGALSAVASGAPPFTVSATASSGLAVTFTTITTPVCTVAVATVTIVAVGSCSITANQGGNADYSAAPSVTQTFAVTTNALTAGSAVAGPGSAYVIPSSVCSYTTQCFLAPGASFSIPVSLSLATSVSVDSLTFGVEIAPNGGAAALTGSLGFSKATAIVDSPFVSAGGTSNSVGIVWSSLTTPLSGSSALGFVTGTLPITAIPGQTYTVTVTGASGALSSASVPVSAGAGGSITVGYTYLAGDVAPKPSDTAPNFGDGVLNILDLIQELFAVNSVPGFVPAACSDRLDAMDLYPADTTATRGGDGVLDIRDLILELFSVNNLDLSRPVRSSRGGCAAAGSSENSETATAAPRATTTTAAPKPEPATEGALILGPSETTSAGEQRVPIYLEARQNLVSVAVTFALGDQQSQLRFVPSLVTPPSFAQDNQLGVVAGAWLSGLNVQAGNRLLLGYVSGPAAALADLKVFGLSASGVNDNREVRLAPPAGPASQ